MSPASFTVRVECHAGHRGEQTPRRFALGGAGREIVETVDCWLGPDHRYFKVLADDGGTYILRHDERADRWELTMFDGRGRPGPPPEPGPSRCGTDDD